MKLDFPNPSRSFDAVKKRARFWGYDSAIEVTFSIEVEALKKLCPEMSNVGAGILKAFDAVRPRIEQVANKAYVRGHDGRYVYTLAAEDF